MTFSPIPKDMIINVCRTLTCQDFKWLLRVKAKELHFFSGTRFSNMISKDNQTQKTTTSFGIIYSTLIVFQRLPFYLNDLEVLPKLPAWMACMLCTENLRCMRRHPSRILDRCSDVAYPCMHSESAKLLVGIY